ncbi:MAG: hypothetical protein DMG13_09335 [Acidobacteria bacterium]|nr:MAG: hypothetical protein DMG13_09335 [Acidobacteriota bacterium]
MEMKCKDIRELSGADQTTIAGGDYVESSLGLISGLAFGAGILVAAPVSAPLVGAALVAGAVFLICDSI